LKEMVKFLDEDGNLESQKLLEQGRIVAQKRIQEMQNNLDYIEYSLKNIEENKDCSANEGVYKRYFDERKIMITDFYTDIDILEPKKFLAETSNIYKYAQKKGMFPILPAGQIMRIKEDGSMFSNEGYSGKLKYTSNDINTSNTSNGYSYSDDVGTSRGAYVNAKATENGIIGFIISGVICVILFAFGVGFIRVLLTFYLLAITIGGALDFKDDYKSNLKSGKSGLDGLIGEVLIFVLVVIPLWILIIFT